MEKAIAIAERAGAAGEVPVGAIVVGPDNQCISSAGNERERTADPTAHAEVLALRQAGQRLGRWNLSQCSLYVTLEPCPMCAGAMLQARIGMLIYGTDDPKTGAIRTVMNLPDSAASCHRPLIVGGIMEGVCRSQLQSWFIRRRCLEQKITPECDR